MICNLHQNVVKFSIDFEIRDLVVEQSCDGVKKEANYSWLTLEEYISIGSIDKHSFHLLVNSKANPIPKKKTKFLD